MSNNVVSNNLTVNGNSTIGSNGTNALLINANATFAGGVVYNTANITHNGNLITNQPIYANNGVVLTGNLTGNFNVPILSAGESNKLIVGRDNSFYPTGNTTTISPNSGLEIFWNKTVGTGYTDFLNKSQTSPTGGFSFNTATVSSSPIQLFVSSSSLFDVKTDAKISTTTASTATTNGALVVSGGVGVAGNLNISGIGNIPTLNSTTGTIATLNSTTGTIATLNSTTGTITTLNVPSSIELGGANPSTVLDIKTQGGNGDFDVRLTTSNGASSTSGQGTLTISSLTNVFTGRVLITNTTASTTTSTGALVVSGGLGVAGSIYSGNLSASSGMINNLLSTSITTNTILSTSSASLTGVSISGNTTTAGNVCMLADGTKSLYFLNGSSTLSSSNAVSRQFGITTPYYDFNDNLQFRRFTGGNSATASNILNINGNGLNVNGQAIIDSNLFVNGGNVKTTGTSLNFGAGGSSNTLNVYANYTQLNNQYLLVVSPTSNSFLCGRPSASRPTTSISSGSFSNPINSGLECFWNIDGYQKTDFLNYTQGGSNGGFTFSSVTYTAPPKTLLNIDSTGSSLMSNLAVSGNIFCSSITTNSVIRRGTKVMMLDIVGGNSIAINSTLSWPMPEYIISLSPNTNNITLPNGLGSEVNDLADGSLFTFRNIGTGNMGFKINNSNLYSKTNTVLLASGSTSVWTASTKLVELMFIQSDWYINNI